MCIHLASAARTGSGGTAAGQRICLEGDGSPHTGCRQSLSSTELSSLLTQTARNSRANASCSRLVWSGILLQSGSQRPCLKTASQMRAGRSCPHEPLSRPQGARHHHLPRPLATRSSCEDRSRFLSCFRRAGPDHNSASAAARISHPSSAIESAKSA